MNSAKKPQQVIWKCAHYNDDDMMKCMEDRGLVTMNNYNRHIKDFHCRGDSVLWETEWKPNLDDCYVVKSIFKDEYQ